MKSLLFAVAITILLSLSSCCSYVPHTITQTDTLIIYQDPELDTLTLIKTDTVWTASNPKYFVRIDTVKKKVYIDRYKDTLYVPYIDTVQLWAPAPKDNSIFAFLDNITIVQTIKLFVILFICLIIIFVWKSFKGI